MKRFFLILFMLVLPFQSSWAAVVSYSQHEALANHTHTEGCAHRVGVVSNLSESRSDGDSGPSTLHGDCTLCHLGHCGVANGEVRPLALPTASLRTPASADPTLSAFSIPPDRPKWLLHA